MLQQIDEIKNSLSIPDSDDVKLEVLSRDGEESPSTLYYLGQFSEDKTQFNGSRIKTTQAVIETYTGSFLVTVAEGVLKLMPPTVPVEAKLVKKQLRENGSSLTHEGFFLNYIRHGYGIETRVDSPDMIAYRHVINGDFIQDQLHGPYKKYMRAEEIDDGNHELIERQIDIQEQLSPDGRIVLGRIHQTITTTTPQKKESVITIEEGHFNYTFDLNANEDYFILMKGRYSKIYPNGSHVSYEGLFSTEKSSLLILDNSRSPEVHCHSARFIEEEIYQYKEGLFQKSALREGFFLTKFYDGAEKITSCYEGKLNAHELADDPNGLFCQHNANTGSVTIHSPTASFPNDKSWFETEINHHELVSITAVSNALTTITLTKRKTSPTGLFIESIQILTPKSAQQLWKMSRNEYGHWSYVAGNNLKELAVTQDKKTLWAKIERMAIRIEVAKPFVPKLKETPLKSLPNVDTAQQCAEKLLREEAAIKPSKKSQKKTVAAENQHPKKSSTSSKKKARPPESTPSPKAVSKKQKPLKEAAAPEFKHVNSDDKDNEMSDVFEDQASTVVPVLNVPTHYPSPLQTIQKQSSLLPGEISAPWMNAPSPIPIWADGPGS